MLSSYSLLYNVGQTDHHRRSGLYIRLLSHRCLSVCTVHTNRPIKRIQHNTTSQTPHTLSIPQQRSCADLPRSLTVFWSIEANRHISFVCCYQTTHIPKHRHGIHLLYTKPPCTLAMMIIIRTRRSACSELFVNEYTPHRPSSQPQANHLRHTTE